MRRKYQKLFAIKRNIAKSALFNLHQIFFNKNIEILNFVNLKKMN